MGWDCFALLQHPTASLGLQLHEAVLQWTWPVQVRDGQLGNPSAQPTIMFWLLYLFNLALQWMDIQSAKALISL